MTPGRARQSANPALRTPGRLRALAFALLAVLPVGAATAQQTSALRVPAVFVENHGQWDPAVLYVARYTHGIVRVEADRIRLQSFPDEQGQSVLVDVAFPDALIPSPPVGEQPRPGLHHFLIGNDPQRWVRDAPGYAAVRYAGLHPGVDLSLGTGPTGLSLCFEARSARDLEAVRLRFDGVLDCATDTSGGRSLRTGSGDLLLGAPVVQANSPDGQVVTAQVTLVADGDCGVRLVCTPNDPLDGIVSVIGLEWSTFLGGTGLDHLYGVAVDATGAVTLTGRTFTPDFPTTPGMIGAPLGNIDGFITRLAADGGSLIFSTYFGGSGGDSLQALAVATDGSFAVAGRTSSPDFPVSADAVFPNLSPGTFSDVVVSVFDPTGSTLIGSTYIGSPLFNPTEEVLGLALDPAGAVVVVGKTGDQWPITPGVVQPLHTGTPGTYDGFVTKLPLDASQLLFSTYFGTSTVEDVHVDDAGTVTVVGYGTISTTPNAFDPSPKGVFIARLSADGTQQLYGTYLGSTFINFVSGVHADERGAITVCGLTLGPDFPSTDNAYDPIWNGVPSVKGDGYVTRISPEGNTLEFSTFLGGIGDDHVAFMAVDSAGTVTVFGGTDHNASFPTTPGSLQPELQGLIDDPGGFMARFHHTGSKLLYSSFTPGTSAFGMPGLGLDVTGAVVYGGLTKDPDFPVTAGAFDTDLDPLAPMSGDSAILKLSLLPLGADRFGSSTPGPKGPIAIGVLSMPQAGQQDFTLNSTNGPPSAQGWLVLALSPLENPIPAVGASLWLDPATLFALLPVMSNAKGYAEVLLPLPQNVGATGHAQFFWPGNPAGGLSASNALSITLQP